MTKERFIKIQSSKGYEIEELGNMVILRQGKYKAVWFFLPNGTLDDSNPPIWSIDRS